MDAQVQSIEKDYSEPRPHHRADHAEDVRVLLAAAREVPDKLVRLASLVQECGLRWGLVVPTDPTDREWVIQLGSAGDAGYVEVVAGELVVALDIAIEEMVRRRMSS